MNPYSDFVKSLTDAQLDEAYLLVPETLAVEESPLECAIIDEWENRERRTFLTVYTPDLDEFRRLLAEEIDDNEVFLVAARAAFTRTRLLLGWGRPLESALVKILIQLVEQLP